MHKKFTISLYFCMVIAVISISLYIFNYCIKENDNISISKCFESTRAKFLKSEIYFSLKLDERFLDADSLKNLINDYENCVGIDKNASVAETKKSNENIESTKYEVKIQRNDIVEINTEIDHKSNQGCLYIKIIQSAETENQKQYIDALKSASLDKHLDYKINKSITGYFDGKIDNNMMDGIYKKMFHEVNAKTVSNIKDNGMISITAYSPGMDESIIVGNKKVNLNFAARYNSYEKRTYIWVANPVIITEY